jgi:hypothetical protein
MMLPASAGSPSLICGFLPTSAFADVFEVKAKLEHANIYSNGGILTYEVPLELPAGSHRILIDGLLLIEDNQQTLQLSSPGSGLTVISRTTKLGPPDIGNYPNLFPSDKAVYDNASAQLDRLQAERDTWTVTRDSALAKIELIKTTEFSATENEDAEGVLNAIDSLAKGLETELSLVAGAKQKIANLDQQIAFAEDQISTLLAQFRGVVDGIPNLPQLDLTVRSENGFSDKLTLSVFAVGVMQWGMHYDADVQQNGRSGRLNLHRHAAIFSYFPFEDFKATITAAEVDLYISDQNIPREDIARLVTPEPAHGDVASLSVPMMDAPVVEESSSSGLGIDVVAESASGQVVHFDLPNRISIGSQKKVRISLDSVEEEVDLFAFTNRWLNEVRLGTRATNTTGRQLLAGTMSIYRDGVYFGDNIFNGADVGETYTLPLGELDGIEIRNEVLASTSGSSWFISSNKTDVDHTRLTFVSHLDYDIDVETIKALPISRNEDLEITTSLAPEPDETSLKGRRGVVKWILPLAAGSSQTIETRTEFKWPSEFELQK